MAMPQFLHQLDALASQGCSDPGCTEPHSDELYLAQRCHPGAGVRVTYAPERPDLPCGAVLSLACWHCQAAMLHIALVAAVPVTPTCPCGQAVDVRYSAGQLTVLCRRCHAVQAMAEVAPYVPA